MASSLCGLQSQETTTRKIIWEIDGEKRVLKLSGEVGDRFHSESSNDLESWVYLDVVELNESTALYELPEETLTNESYWHAYLFNETPPEIDKGMKSSSMVTAQDGGEILGPNGARLVVPPDAVSSDVVISITAPEQNANQMHFLLEPQGLTFKKPVRFELPISYEGEIEAFPWRFTTSSDLNPQLESTYETTNWEQVNEIYIENPTGRPSISLDHFTYIYAANRIQDKAYLVFDIPKKYLLPGDILFTLTSFKQNKNSTKQPNWQPGHVGVLIHPNGINPKDPRSIIHADGETVKLDMIDGFRNLDTDGHLYLGARRPGGGLNKKERDEMVRIINAQRGKNYSKLGTRSNGNLHSCVSLIEYALDMIGRGTLSSFQDITIPTPYEMYIATFPVNEITVDVGENVEIPIYAAVVDPSRRIDTISTAQGSVTTISNEFYNRRMLFPELDITAFYYEIKMDLNSITSSPNTFRRDHNPSYRISFDGGILNRPNGYIFRWKPEPKHAGRSFTLPVTLTAHPSFLLEGRRKQEKDFVLGETLTIHVRPLPECTEEEEPNDDCSEATPMGDSKCAFGSIQKPEPSRADSPVIGADYFIKSLNAGRYRVQANTETPTILVKTTAGNSRGNGTVDFELTESEDVCIEIFTFREVESYAFEILEESAYCETGIVFENKSSDQTLSFKIVSDEIPVGQTVTLAPGETFAVEYPHPLTNLNLIEYAVDGFLVGGDGNQQFQFEVTCGRTQHFVWSGFLEFSNTPLVDTEDLAL